MVRTWLKLEGLLTMCVGVYVYYQYGFNFWIFILLLLVPDVSMLGYLINKKVGANIYNVIHSYSIPLILYVLGNYLSENYLIAASLIWICHIGMDRLVGYGLKYETDFKDTHLNRV